LHEMRASVDQNILRLICVSLKRREKFARVPLASFKPYHRF
jgi:hypothetical protein